MIELLRKRMLLPIIFLALVVMAFCFQRPSEIWEGYLRILVSPSILVTDYIAVGGIGATFINAAILLCLGVLLLRLLDLRVTGPIFAGLMTVVGFAFFGKNILNVVPIILGIYLYTLAKKIPMRNMIIIIYFSTGISPIVSYTMFGIGLSLYLSIPLGILIGVLIGFIIPPISSNTIKFHSGYNLYNIGFALGLLAVVFTGIYKTLGIQVNMATTVSTEYSYHLYFFILGMSLMFIVMSFIFNKECYKRYPELLKSSGRLVSDYIRDYSIETTMLNVGISGIVCLITALVLQINLNGPVAGVILTVMGFSSFGKHIRNIIPVMAGAILVAVTVGLFTPENLHPKDNINSALAVFLVTGLAPIAGRYGLITGLFVGVVHMFVVRFAGIFQGGFDLYNNGFAAGFIAAIFIPILETFEEVSNGFTRRKENRENN